MVDYSNSRNSLGGIFPDNAIASARQHLEPLITPDQLRTRHLFGIPLVSASKDPITNKAQIMSNDVLKDIIEGAIATAESELKIDIFPVERREKSPFDINRYHQFGYLQLEHKPCSNIKKLSVTPSSDLDVYVVPTEWIENAYFIKGQVNIVPLTIAFVQGTSIPQQSTGGVAFLQILGNKAWIPAWWQIEYTSGYPDGMLPRIINEYIGTIASLEILSMLAVTYGRVQGHSLGIDGLSQSVSTPGPQIFKIRVDELRLKKEELTKKIKVLYGYKIFSGTF